MFYRKLTVTLDNIAGAGDVHYTIDGSDPTPASAKYSAPLEIAQTTTLKAAAFDGDHRIGFDSADEWYKADYEKNLTTGKPVTASSHQDKYVPENAVDGRTDTAWWAAPAPQWIQVDLLEPHTVDRIVVFPYFDGRRFYQYVVEGSLDGKKWDPLVDMSKNTTPATASGDVHDIKATSVRYLKVTMLKNSANEGVHLAELRAYEVGKHPQ